MHSRPATASRPHQLQDDPRTKAPSRSAYRRNVAGRSVHLLYALLAFGSLIVFVFGALGCYSLVDRVLAWAVLIAACVPGLLYLREPSGLPFFAVACALYAVAYSIPVFHRSEIVNLWGRVTVRPRDMSVTLLLCVIALICLHVGYSGRATTKVVLWLPPVRLHLRAKRALFLAGVVAAAWLVTRLWLIAAGGHLPLAWRQLANFLTPVYAAQAIVIQLHIHRKLGRFGGHMVAAMTLVLVGVGLAMGSLQLVIAPLLTATVVYLAAGRRLRLQYLLLGLFLLIVLQPVKGRFRAEVWYGPYRDLSATERAIRFVDLAWTRWSNVGEPDRSVAELSEPIANRVSLLHEAALVVSDVPRRIPYRMGESYRYLFFALVPRVLYPDKPTAQESNVWFALNFGFLAPKHNQQTMVGISHVAEAYANFGLFGVPLVFLVLGFMYRAVHRLFGSPGSGIGAVAVYAQLLGDIPSPASGLAGSLGGMLQTIVFYSVVAWLLNDRGLEREVTSGTSVRGPA